MKTTFLGVSALLCALLSPLALAQQNNGQYSGDQLLSISALDAMPSKGFREFWAKVGNENSYNLMRQSPDSLSMMENAALTGPWLRWAEFSDASRFYLAGLIVSLKIEGRRKNLSDEDFKSKVIGIMQCTNGVYHTAKSSKHDNTGNVETLLSLCAAYRTMLMK